MPKPKRVTPTYRDAIVFIADNFAEDMNLDGDMTVGLVAALFGYEPARVANDIRVLRGHDERSA